MRWSIVAAALAMGGACGGGGNRGFTSASQATQSLSGTWQATKAQFTNRANSGQSVDIVARGSSVTLALEAGGTFTLRIVDPGQPGNSIVGTWTASRDVLTIVQSGRSGNTQFDVTMNGNALTLAGGHIEFDVNADGAAEECVLDMALNRV